jgi:predicted Zn-ribbon and HTH transcriptional regulator
MARVHTIKEDTIALLTRKRPMTYERIVEVIQRKHPEAQTSVKTVQWYASRLRAAGTEVNVKRANDRRNWNARAKGTEAQRAH